MAIDPNEIQPIEGATAAPTAPAPEPVVDDTEPADLPDEILAIPAFQGILEGRPAAVYDYKGSGSPVIEAIPKHFKELADAGIGFYQSKDGVLAVMYNSQFISPEELEKADEAGTLTEVAEPLQAVTAAYDSVLGGEAPAPSSSTGAPAPTPTGSPAPTPAGVEKKLTTARLTNIQPGSPTSGPVPGAGRVLNNVLKRAV